jgi:hypothetical protein
MYHGGGSSKYFVTIVEVFNLKFDQKYYSVLISFVTKITLSTCMILTEFSSFNLEVSYSGPISAVTNFEPYMSSSYHA